MRLTSRRLAIIVSLAVLFAGGCGQRRAAWPKARGVRPGRPAASTTAMAASTSAASPVDNVGVQMLNFEGIEQMVASHQGQRGGDGCLELVVSPCVREFPNLVAAARRAMAPSGCRVHFAQLRL